MLLKDHTAAHQQGQIGAAVSASMGLAKLHGFLVEKIRSDAPRDLCELTDAKLKAMIVDSLTKSQLEELEATATGDGHVASVPLVGKKKPH
jgi:hypothetical protein